MALNACICALSAAISPLFQAVYMKALAALRNGEFAKSIKTIAEIRDDRGNNKAADRKVRLQVCQALLGEGEGKRMSPSTSGADKS
jgi:hypothetical protein